MTISSHQSVYEAGVHTLRLLKSQLGEFVCWWLAAGFLIKAHTFDVIGGLDAPDATSIVMSVCTRA